jgi:hypothetical protein
MAIIWNLPGQSQQTEKTFQLATLCPAPESNWVLPHHNSFEQILGRADVHPALRDLLVFSLRGWLDAIIWSLPRQTRGRQKKDVKTHYVWPPNRTGFFHIIALKSHFRESRCAPCTAGLCILISLNNVCWRNPFHATPIARTDVRRAPRDCLGGLARLVR